MDETLRAVDAAAAVFQEFARDEIEVSIPCRFEQMAALHAHEPAIHSPRHQWNYGELSQCVDQVAAALVSACGVSRGNVALLFEQDAPMVGAMLGALKAGKAYVPLDPDYPRKRLEYMLADSEAVAILACNSTIELAERLAGNEVSLVNLDTVERVAKPAFPKVSPVDTAYILYTSGSTGTPKGVVQNHRNVLHFIRNYTNNLKLTCRDNLTLLSSYSFDAAVMAIYGAMLNGACLFPKSVASEGFASIGPWLNENAITIYHSTPTVFRYFLGSCREGDEFTSVRHVVLGGEPVVRNDVELCRRFFPNECVMVNGLGPTESTVTLQYFISSATEIVGNAVPVGRPVSETEVYLIGEDGAVSEGEGEIVFKSEHLAVEYWNRSDLTASAFSVDPENPALRTYRTGDLGRWLPDGTLEFLGRRDHQVKLHGVRIELGEIEAMLAAAPAVDQAVVVPQTAASGETQLIAYVIMRGGVALDHRLLRNHLREVLPSSMHPSAFAKVDRFPMTPTGKLDRKAFPRPQPVEFARAGSRAAPQTEIQRVLLDIWTELLEVGTIGIDDDFFELGGDSLSAVRVCDAISHRLGRTLSIVKLFECRVVRDLAALLEKGGDAEETGPRLVPLSRHEAKAGGHLFCICGIYLYEPLARSIGEPHSVSGVFLPVEQESLATGSRLPAVEEMAAMYGDVIRKEQPHGPYRLAGLSFGGVLAYELARQLRANGDEVDVLALFDAMLPNTVSLGTRVAAHAKLLLSQGPSYLIERMRRRLRRAGGVPEDPEFVDESLPEQSHAIARLRGRIYDDAAGTYRKNIPSYDGNAIFFRAVDCSEYRKLVDGPDCGWSRFIKGRLHTVDAHGTHITMLQKPNVEVIGHELRQALDDAIAR
jgi:amino acid adenylation domain-containing protein